MCDWSLAIGFSLGGLLMGFAIGAFWMESHWQRWRASVVVPVLMQCLHQREQSEQEHDRAAD